jgi:hypothetical protein
MIFYFIFQNKIKLHVQSLKQAFKTYAYTLSICLWFVPHYKIPKVGVLYILLS